MTLDWRGSSACFNGHPYNVYIALDVLVAVTVTEQVVKVSSPLARYASDKWMGPGISSIKTFSVLQIGNLSRGLAPELK